ncbi:TniQ family protein [Paraburkholderia tropica]|uniref:TniQ family protein n=1 Tax=Paraburkholderia tropica TaxID=92647 RepID=UPI002ABD13E7|nr:TniQ family protein [Paraburkholderia tropica]
MHPITLTNKCDLVEPLGIGTGLVEASSSLWKRSAERLSVGLGDFARWAFDRQNVLTEYPREVTGQLVLYRRWLGVDGLTSVAEVYLDPLKNMVASENVKACTLLPFAGLLSEKNLIRRYRAWCPLCLASMQKKKEIYEPLLWRLQDVTACPVHGVSLITVCQKCLIKQQDLFSSYSRVGCCNRCGSWMGAGDAGVELNHADESDVALSRTISSLLAETERFKSDNHDGRFTFRKLVSSRRMRDVLAATLDRRPETLTRQACSPGLPRLAVLATIASAAQQPLHRVILGQLAPWVIAGQPSNNSSRRNQRKDWVIIEKNMKLIANGADYVNLRDACQAVGVSMGSARIHFPSLVSRIVLRGKKMKHKEFVDRRNLKINNLKRAFRSLVDSEIYPSIHRLSAISGLNSREVSGMFSEVVKNERRRAGI